MLSTLQNLTIEGVNDAGIALLDELLIAGGTAADRYWLGTTDSDPGKIANWSESSGGAGGASLPGSGDTAIFDGNGNNACTMTDDWDLAELSVLAGYTAKLDFNGHDLTMDDGGSVTCDGVGEIDWGEGTISLTNGTFDIADQTTNTCGTSTLVLNGTCTLKGGATSAKTMYSLSVPEGDTTTVSENSYFAGTQTIDGTLSVATGKTYYCYGAGDLYLNDSSTVSGLGTLALDSNTLGHGLILEAGYTSSITNIRLVAPVTGTLLPALTTSGALTIEAAAAACVLDTMSGTYNIGTTCKASVSTGSLAITPLAGTVLNVGASLEFESTGAGSITLTNTNAPTINVGTDLILDVDAGTVTIDEDSAATAWSIGGNVVNEIIGTFTYSNASAATWTFDGTGDQSIDFGTATMNGVSVDKATGDIAFTAGTFVALAAGAVNSTDFTCSGTASFDLNTADMTLLDGGNFLADTAGTFDFGTGAVTLRGNVTATSGTLTGGTAPITISGSGNQAVDLNDNTIATLTVTNTGGTVTFTDGWTATTYLANDGIVDYNGETFETTGNFSHIYPATIVAGADAMNGVDITVGGNCILRGASGALLNLNGTAEWTLDTTGSNRAVYADISYCTATPGEDLMAFGCTDSDNNNDVIFDALIDGRTCWGHDTDVEEDNVLNFAGEWTGTAEIVNSGVDDTEKLVFQDGEYMETIKVIETGANEVSLLTNKYVEGDEEVVIKYRHGDDPASCMIAEWNQYEAPFNSLGYVQVRLEVSIG